MAFQPGEGYMILMNQAVDICFAGDLVTTALPFIDVQ